jgi:hypothetical protein
MTDNSASNEASNSEETTKLLRIGRTASILWLLCGALVVIAYFFGIHSWAPNNFGDTLAGVFAPLAFLWLVIATLLQRRELELQREELKLARMENREAREIYKQQQKEMKETAAQTKRQAEAVEASNNINLTNVSYNNYITLYEVLMTNVIGRRELFAVSHIEEMKFAGRHQLLKLDFNILSDQNYAKIIGIIDELIDSANEYLNRNNNLRKVKNFNSQVVDLKRLCIAVINYPENDLILNYNNALNITKTLIKFNTLVDRMEKLEEIK